MCFGAATDVWQEDLGPEDAEALHDSRGYLCCCALGPQLPGGPAGLACCGRRERERARMLRGPLNFSVLPWRHLSPCCARMRSFPCSCACVLGSFCPPPRRALLSSGFSFCPPPPPCASLFWVRFSSGFSHCPCPQSANRIVGLKQMNSSAFGMPL